ncbi:MAG: cbb3-type cytochrome oxidase assembly protein [Gemmatimonadetes bacterium]|uniref:Cbb3-type cytochrome oxidase assembly protein n=1 Tax=Candidatus Kutchimonas denitrificans TaxID=3056748 RepID=A0AAE4Z8X3_9BACT|nr:cbb3-type cytochrome oxidase assembly protein [Gemmatimonadota bacterium]NIR73631.1 cbb3-type cytochrome oxidase assembly protein [Candidatus Kutchimonas denitrificans]NIR99590.1 cbb3-type cytochrome oxidase assembly protein [Gemmatimonadota bacterium]NIT65210.1 cbb3-type cytochrome oxidase assembly protein [Gemmatimonadota bacterium]NIV23743.1 cbb3-type cytochrome oxidase assembly protein CcoS [Gemmatimonadota bacterium]
MFEQLTLLQFLVALSMSLAALCVFIWAVLSGMFKDVEAPKYRMYEMEIEEDERTEEDR